MRGRKPATIVTSSNLATAVPSPPTWLSKEAKAEWRRVATILIVERKTLTTADLGTLANYCTASGTMCQAQRIINAEGLVLAGKRHPAFGILNAAQTTQRLCAAELGLTPVSRSRPTMREDQDNDDDPSPLDLDGSEIPDPFGYGERAVRFLRSLKHPKSNLAGRAFQLDPWQERIVRRIYGPRHPDGTRIVRTVFLLLPRGNRKTTLAAALALLHTIGPERSPGGEVVSAASDRKQARLGFTEALEIIRADKRVEAAITLQDYRNRLTYPRAGSFYEAISADAGTQHGRTPVFVLADELHAWKKRDLWDVLRSGLPKTKGTLCIIATTAGRGQENVAHELYTYARRVALGEIDDPAFLPVLFEAHKDCYWRDEAIWHAVNPGLALGYPDLEGLRQLAREAENRPGDREAFRQLHLNIWLDHSADPFVDMAVYDQGNQPVDLVELEREGGPCWLAVDLSSNSDLTVIVAAWLDGQGGFIVRPWFFCPADNLRGRADRDGVPYPTWAEQGFITPTSGNVVDFRKVEQTIRDLCARFDVREIAFDPHLARNMLNTLAEDGYPAVEMRQGWVTMAPAIKELERAILAGRFRHGGHPVLRWNVDNVAVDTDKAGNKSFHKGKSRDRIDGAVAAAMAVARAAAGDGGSIYNSSARSSGLLVF